MIHKNLCVYVVKVILPLLIFTHSKIHIEPKITYSFHQLPRVLTRGLKNKLKKALAKLVPIIGKFIDTNLG